MISALGYSENSFELHAPGRLCRGRERWIEPWEFDEAQRAEVAAARCFGDAEVRLVDGRDFCWHGARMADGLGRALDAVRS